MQDPTLTVVSMTYVRKDVSESSVQIGLGYFFCLFLLLLSRNVCCLYKIELPKRMIHPEEVGCRWENGWKGGSRVACVTLFTDEEMTF